MTDRYRTDADAMRRALERCRAERDEARAEVEQLRGAADEAGRRARDEGGKAAYDDYDQCRESYAKAKAEVERLRGDLADAAGELLVSLPEPGTEVAKLLSANVLLRAEVKRLRHRCCDNCRHGVHKTSWGFPTCAVFPAFGAQHPRACCLDHEPRQA